MWGFRPISTVLLNGNILEILILLRMKTKKCFHITSKTIPIFTFFFLPFSSLFISLAFQLWSHCAQQKSIQTERKKTILRKKKIQEKLLERNWSASWILSRKENSRANRLKLQYSISMGYNRNHTVQIVSKLLELLNTAKRSKFEVNKELPTTKSHTAPSSANLLRANLPFINKIIARMRANVVNGESMWNVSA